MALEAFAVGLAGSVGRACLTTPAHCLASHVPSCAAHRARLQELPDTQRRDAAAALVTQLMAAMGGVSSDEEGADSGSEAGS